MDPNLPLNIAPYLYVIQNKNQPLLAQNVYTVAHTVAAKSNNRNNTLKSFYENSLNLVGQISPAPINTETLINESDLILSTSNVTPNVEEYLIRPPRPKLEEPKPVVATVPNPTSRTSVPYVFTNNLNKPITVTSVQMLPTQRLSSHGHLSTATPVQLLNVNKFLKPVPTAVRPAPIRRNNVPQKTVHIVRINKSVLENATAATGIQEIDMSNYRPVNLIQPMQTATTSSIQRSKLTPIPSPVYDPPIELNNDPLDRTDITSQDFLDVLDEILEGVKTPKPESFSSEETNHSTVSLLNTDDNAMDGNLCESIVKKNKKCVKKRPVKSMQQMKEIEEMRAKDEEMEKIIEPKQDEIAPTLTSNKVATVSDSKTEARPKVTQIEKNDSSNKDDIDMVDEDIVPDKITNVVTVTRSGRPVKPPKSIDIGKASERKVVKKRGVNFLPCLRCPQEFTSILYLQRHYEHNPTHMPDNAHKDLFTCLQRIVEDADSKNKTNVFLEQLQTFITRLRKLLPCLLKKFEKEEGKFYRINEDVGKLFGLIAGNYDLNIDGLSCIKHIDGSCKHSITKINTSDSQETKAQVKPTNTIQTTKTTIAKEIKINNNNKKNPIQIIPVTDTTKLPNQTILTPRFVKRRKRQPKPQLKKDINLEINIPKDKEIEIPKAHFDTDLNKILPKSVIKMQNPPKNENGILQIEKIQIFNAKKSKIQHHSQHFDIRSSPIKNQNCKEFTHFQLDLDSMPKYVGKVLEPSPAKKRKRPRKSLLIPKCDIVDDLSSDKKGKKKCENLTIKKKKVESNDKKPDDLHDGKIVETLTNNEKNGNDLTSAKKPNDNATATNKKVKDLHGNKTNCETSDKNNIVLTSGLPASCDNNVMDFISGKNDMDTYNRNVTEFTSHKIDSDFISDKKVEKFKKHNNFKNNTEFTSNENVMDLTDDKNDEDLSKSCLQSPTWSVDQLINDSCIEPNLIHVKDIIDANNQVHDQMDMLMNYDDSQNSNSMNFMEVRGKSIEKELPLNLY